MSHILTHIEDHVLHIVINRVDKKNALTRSMYQQMADAIFDAKHHPDIRVILLKCHGDCFTAGNDIQDFASKEESEHVAETAAFMRALMDCEKPVIAQVHGVAVGIGTTMLLHCDFVYAQPNTRFVLPFINLGLVPEYASSYLLPKIAGRRKASEWLMLGEPFGTEDAYQFGLLTDIVPETSLSDKVMSVCKKLVEKPAFSLLQTKSLLNNDTDLIRQQMDIELDVFIQAMGMDAAQEAFDAFLNKRPINPDKFK